MQSQPSSVGLDSRLYDRLWNGDRWCTDIRMWLCSVGSGLPLLDGHMLVLYPSPLFLSFLFSHLLLLILYNPWYAGAYLYWWRFAFLINIVGGDLQATWKDSQGTLFSLAHVRIHSDNEAAISYENETIFIINGWHKEPPTEWWKYFLLFLAF